MGKFKATISRFWSQSAIAIFLFLIFIFLGALLSGLVVAAGVNFSGIPIYLPIPTITWEINYNWALWLGVLGASASIAAFLSTWLRRKFFVYYKIVDYPADHLKILHEIKGNPKTVEDVAISFDIPPSVAERVLEDLWVDGLLQKLGDGGKTIYYFPFEKKLAQMREDKKEEEKPDITKSLDKFAKRK